jgi:hypothetical protein
MPWEERFISEIGKALFAKRFLEDPDTGHSADGKIPGRLHQHLAHLPLRAWHVRAGRHPGNPSGLVRSRQLRVVSRRHEDAAWRHPGP